MQKIRIAFGTDHYQKIYNNIVCLADEALKRKYEVYWFDFNKVRKKNKVFYVPLRKLLHKVHLTKKKMLSAGPVTYTDLTLLDVILIKKDPPVSHRCLNLLKKASKFILVVNDPQGILKYESKTYLKKFKNLTAPTYFSSHIGELEKAVKKLGNCVLKLDIGFGGSGVYHVFTKNGKYYVESKTVKKPRLVNLKFLLKRLTKNGVKEVLVVKYLKRVTNGDKRILILDGHILGAFTRLPKNKSGWICNVSSGGYAKRTRITKDEAEIVRSVEHVLKKDNVYTVGIDTLEDDSGKRVLSEVNTTNVGGLYTIERLYKRNATKYVMDWVEKKVVQNSR